MTVADSSSELVLDRPTQPPSPPDAADPRPEDQVPSVRDRLLRWSKGRVDRLVLAGYLVSAIWVTAPLWIDPAGRVGRTLQGDPALMQWFLAHAVRVVSHGENPLFTMRMNVPDGVNLMANTPMLGLTMPMVPVTVLFGPAVSFVTLVTLGLSLTAAAWYFVLSRHLVSSRLAAAVGGWFCGFCPAMLAHANWHPNIISQFLVPFIVWRVLALCRPGARPVRDGVILALLVVYQAFINEEILLFAALACGIFLLAVVVQRRELWALRWRSLALGLAVCAVVVGALLAYPLYIQFAGPQHYAGLRDAVPDHGNDIAAYLNAGSTTFAGSRAANEGLAPNYSEENAFFGWSLIILLIAVAWWRRRDVIVRALTVTALIFAVLSFGERLAYHGHPLMPGPWAWLVRLPVLDSVVPTRFGMITSVLVGIVLAAATDRIRGSGARYPAVARRLWIAALLVALVPVAPLPLREAKRSDVPDFITSGDWRPYVSEGQTLVPVPLPELDHPDGLRWAAAQHLDFRLPRGYFLGPRNGKAGDAGQFGAPASLTVNLLRDVATTGVAPPLGNTDRRRVQDDLRFWRAAIVVLLVEHPQAAGLRRTLEDVLGPARRVDDVWLWDVRAMNPPPPTGR